MYAVVDRRQTDFARAQKARERAQRVFFPKLQRAPGFVSFTLVQGKDGVATAVVLWESQVQTDAFRAEAEAWQRAPDEFGHGLETQGRGEVVALFARGA